LPSAGDADSGAVQDPYYLELRKSGSGSYSDPVWHEASQIAIGQKPLGFRDLRGFVRPRIEGIVS
jgi:hypothetical protein